MSWTTQTKHTNGYKQNLKRSPVKGYEWGDIDLTWEELKTLEDDPTWAEWGANTWTTQTKHTNDFTNLTKH